jgi:hypothetical protein
VKERGTLACIPKQIDGIGVFARMSDARDEQERRYERERTGNGFHVNVSDIQ